MTSIIQRCGVGIEIIDDEIFTRRAGGSFGPVCQPQVTEFEATDPRLAPSAYGFESTTGQPPAMRHLCLMLSRLTTAAWVGAACLFIVTTLQDVHSPELSSVDKAEIVVRKFPIYYRFGFGLLIPALLLAVAGQPLFSGKRRWLIGGLVFFPLLLLGADYVWIYEPLETMTAAVDRARPAEFIDYHSASKWINTVQVTSAVVATVAVCWPVNQQKGAG